MAYKLNKIKGKQLPDRTKEIEESLRKQNTAKYRYDIREDGYAYNYTRILEDFDEYRSENNVIVVVYSSKTMFLRINPNMYSLLQCAYIQGTNDKASEIKRALGL